MASKRKSESPPNPPDLPSVLVRARERAVAGSSPEPTPGDSESVPLLLEFLEPRMVAKIDHKGNGEAPKVLREPMVMLSWDRMAGRWKWSLSDKTLNISGQTFVSDLAGAIPALEEALQLDKVNWKERKVT